MKNIRLLLAYDGTNYAGWQIQPAQPTIQKCIEDAVKQLTGKHVNVLSAGRTDSGVHALGQVASFQSDFNIEPHKWRPALQSRLPEDIVVLESSEVAKDFHATFSTTSKRYRYVIDNSLVEDPFFRKYVWRIQQPLDVQLMQQAANVLIGKHDFRSFETNWPNKASSVRTVKSLTLQRCCGWDVWSPMAVVSRTQQTDEAGRFIVLEIEADGFLYNMVRTITGTLINVGRGTWAVDEVERILKSQDRRIAGATAAASGLYMVQVNYPEAKLRPPTAGETAE